MYRVKTIFSISVMYKTLFAKSTGLITYREAVQGDVDDVDDGDVHHDISE